MNKAAKIVIASVLKPVNDVRMYEKIGLSLNKFGHEVIIAGSPNTSTQDLRLSSFQWNEFPRLSLKRLMIQFRFWKVLSASRPDLVICCTHELLLCAVLFRLFFGTKVIYDIQEDYFKNLWFQHNYPPIIRHLLALVIRSTEYLMSRFISGYLLAEKIYEDDISFTKNKSLNLENKSLPIQAKRKSEFKFIFTGTLSPYSRTKESIQYFLQLKKHLPEADLTVIGHCPSHKYYDDLRNEFDKKVTLNISTQPVPHEQIVIEIERANFGIIGYLPNPINAKKVPTKLYEYTAAELPYLVQSGTYWSDLGHELGGAISVDFHSSVLDACTEKIRNNKDYSFKKDPVYWETQEKPLIDYIKSILD